MVEDRDPDELVAKWTRVESELRAALVDVEVREKTRAWVLECLDHNELGLAFQTLVEALDDDQARLSAVTLDRLERAAREMALEDDAAWRRLSARVA